MINLYEATLKEARELFGLTAEEAAAEIGNCSLEQWLEWEDDDLLTPESVYEKVDSLFETWANIVKGVMDLGDSAKEICAIYYPTADYCESVLEWRFNQAISKYLADNYGVTLIPFNIVSFSEFMRERALKDSKETRSMWAGMINEQGTSH